MQIADRREALRSEWHRSTVPFNHIFVSLQVDLLDLKQGVQGPPTWLPLLNSKGIECRAVVGITSPRVATSRAEDLQLASAGAHVVDMESYQVISAGNQAQTPVAVIRVVSDSLDRVMPDFNRALKPDGEVDSLKVARIFLGSPITSLKLLSIFRGSTQKLKEALEFILPAGISSSAGS